MFDIGWSELLVLGAIALIVVGPKDLPMMLRRLGQFVGQAKRMAREFQRTMEDAADQADLKELRDVQKSMSDWNRKIGGDAPRKYAERVLNGEDERKPAPAPGSHDAADAAEKAAWEAEQAEKAAHPSGNGQTPPDPAAEEPPRASSSSSGRA